MGEIDPRAPFWLAAAISVTSFLFGLFVLPESLAAENRAPLTWRSAHPVGVFRSLWREYPILKAWQCGLLLISLGFAGINSIFFLYVTFRFGWTPKTIGFYATFVMLTSLAVQTGLVARVIARFGERRVLLGGIVVQLVGTAAVGLAPTGALFVAAVFVVVLGGVAAPARLSIVNRIIAPTDRGRLSGAERSVESLTGIVAPGVFAAMFAAVVAAGPHSMLVGVPVLVGAVLIAGGLFVTVWSVRRTNVLEPL